MLKYLILLWAAIFFNALVSISADKTKYAKYSKVECNGSPDWMKNVECKINEISQYNNSADLSATIIKPLAKMEMHVKLYKLPDVENPFFINYEFDGCEVLSGEKSHAFMDTFGTAIKKYTNLNHPCPYKDEIYAHGFSIYDIPIWSSAPLGDYRLDLDIFETKHVPIGSMKFYYQIGEY